ncbi:GPP34 family phosphoprotein [Streptomyces sp. NPDC050617]|uniref:GOLPH3/VPS74 family protein n=1 Tax=Streptomyces sp. NPDC050617 TaxID=3154628 RepID=UPI0034158DD5
MDPTLPRRMYLLSLYTEAGEPGLGRYRGLLMRAAALTELSIEGRLGDRDGRVVVRDASADATPSGTTSADATPSDATSSDTTSSEAGTDDDAATTADSFLAEPPSDPFLAEALREVAADKPRHWIAFLLRDAHTAEAAVREQLGDTGVITVRQGRALGVLPTRKVTVNTPEEVRVLREKARNAVLLGPDPATVPVDETAMAVLAAEGEIESVFTLTERWKHRKAFAALGDQFDAVVPGLRQALRAAVASSRSAGGGWSR